MNQNKLVDRLKKLLALTESPNAEEARTAAWLVIKTARDNGVTISFKVPVQAPAQQKTVPVGTVPVDTPWGGVTMRPEDVNALNEILRVQREMRQKRRGETGVANAKGVLLILTTGFYADKCVRCHQPIGYTNYWYYLRENRVAHEECGWASLVM